MGAQGWRNGRTVLSTVMAVIGGIGTIKVYVAIPREATMFVVWCWIDSLPSVVHELLDIVRRCRAMGTSCLLPIVEDRIVEWGKALRSVRRHE